MHVVFTFPSFTAVVASFAMTFISEQEIHAHVNFWNCWHCCCIIIANILTCFMVHTKYFWMSFQVIWSDFYMNRLRQNNCSYWKIWALPIRGEILVLISEISRTIKQKRSAVRNFRKQDNLARYIYRNVRISFSGNFCSISTSLPAFPEFRFKCSLVENSTIGSECFPGNFRTICSCFEQDSYENGLVLIYFQTTATTIIFPPVLAITTGE